MITVLLYHRAIKRTTTALRSIDASAFDLQLATVSLEASRNQETKRMRSLPLVARATKSGTRYRTMLLRARRMLLFSVMVFHIWYISVTTILVA